MDWAGLDTSMLSHSGDLPVHHGACRQQLTTEDERHRMVGRHLAWSDRVCWAVPGMKVTMGFA